MKLILKITFIMLVATTLMNCSENDESGDSVTCQDVGLSCSKTPIHIKHVQIVMVMFGGN